MYIGNMIRERRQYLRMTQAQLADSVCVTQQAVAKWESDVCLPDMQSVSLLAEVLGFLPEELLGLNVPVNAKRPKICNIKNEDTSKSFGLVGTEKARKWVVEHKDKFVILVRYGYDCSYRLPKDGETARVIIP